VKPGPHAAALGLMFYTGDVFPAECKSELFIAQHGSWNRSNPLGNLPHDLDIAGPNVPAIDPE
jgi:glucose/arabinose dehydrogenase